MQQRLVRELEKKFSGKDVVLIANRRVMPTPSSGKTIARPRSRTLTAVRLGALLDLSSCVEIAAGGKARRLMACIAASIVDMMLSILLSHPLLLCGLVVQDASITFICLTHI